MADYVNATCEKVGCKETLRDKFVNATNRFGIWWSKNREWAIIVVPVVLTTGVWILKKGISSIGTLGTLRAEKALKTLYIYDRSTGHYWHLKRELTSSEQLLVEERMKKGETLGKIFQDMNVLKK